MLRLYHQNHAQESYRETTSLIQNGSFHSTIVYLKLAAIKQKKKRKLIIFVYIFFLLPGESLRVVYLKNLRHNDTPSPCKQK